MIPLSSQIKVFEVQDPPKIVPKIVQKMKLKADPPKSSNFWFLEPPRQEQEAKRPPKGSPMGGQGGAKMAKKDVQEGPEIRPVSKGGPKWLRWPLEGAF